MRAPITGSARAASTSACSCQPDVGAGGVAEEEEVEGLARAAGVDVAHHGAGRAEDARPGPRCRSASAARCGSSAAPPGGAGAPGPRRKPISGEIAPKDDPGDVDDEEHEHHLLDAGQPADRQHQPHLVRQEDGEQERGRATRPSRARRTRVLARQPPRAGAVVAARAHCSGMASGASGGSGAAAAGVRRRVRVSCSIGRPRSRRSAARRSAVRCASPPARRLRDRART